MTMTDWFEVYCSDLWVSLYVHPIEVSRETKHTIFTKHGRISKSTKRSKFFPTFNEAKTYALSELDERITLLEQQKNEIMKKKPKT